MPRIDFSHKTDDSPISLGDLREQEEKFRAVLNAEKSTERSKQYTHLTSTELIPIAESADWVLFNAIAKRRNHRTDGSILDPSTVTHQLAFRPSDGWLESRGLLGELRLDGGIGKVSKMIPRLLFTNNHAGTGKCKFDLASYDFVCSNTAIMLAERFGSWAFSHINLNPEKLAGFFRQVIEASPFLFNLRRELSRIELERSQALELAERVIDLRWNGKAYSVEPASLIAPRYEEQSALNAYNVLQTLQGHLVGGNARDTSAEGHLVANVTTEAKQLTGRKKTRKQAPVKSFSEQLRINRGLWDATAGYLKEIGYSLPEAPHIRPDVYGK